MKLFVGYSKAPEKPQSSARPMCQPHTMTSTGREPATIHMTTYRPRIGGKIVHDIKQRVAIFSPQSYSRSQTELYDNRSALCWGQLGKQNINCILADDFFKFRNWLGNNHWETDYRHFTSSCLQLWGVKKPVDSINKTKLSNKKIKKEKTRSYLPFYGYGN